ncbi:MAG: arginase [Acidobacteria bacterium]|nr:arginase [Acidobacteriota bacterium]
MAPSGSSAQQQLGLELEQRAPIRPGEQPSIPLDVEDPSYNLWRTLRDFSQDDREPGLINVQKYDLGMAWAGIPTFFRKPIALTPADLKAGKVEVAVMGGYLDMGSGMRGAALGPNAFRNSDVYGGWGPLADAPNMHTMVDPMKDLVIADFGDAPIDIMSTERSLGAIREFVRSAVEVEYEPGKNVMPVIIGGDHSLMYPDVAALTDVYGRGNVGVIHFDAHYDAGKYGFGHLINHGMPVYRLMEEDLVPGPNFIQVGLRGYYPGRETFEWMREEGMRYHSMAEVERDGWDAVMERVIAEANDGHEYLFISFDIDTIDPAFVPGTGTPEPGGLLPREAFPIVRRLCAESNVVGFELVELNPLVDQTYVSAMVANRVVRECLTGVAMRKRGLTDPHYISPLAAEHAAFVAETPASDGDTDERNIVPAARIADPIFGPPSDGSNLFGPMAVAFLFGVVLTAAVGFSYRAGRSRERSDRSAAVARDVRP